MPGNTRQKKILAVDWDAHTLRVVHALLGKRGVKIDKLLAVSVPADVRIDDPKQMGQLIRRTLDQEGISTRHAVVDVPRDQAILKTLSLPTTQTDALPGMVEIQIAKELPFPVSDAVVDFAVAPRTSDSPEGDVLVGAVRHEVLEQIEATFQRAGLKLDRVGLRPYANQVAVNALLEHGMPERVIFIDVRRTFMEIDVLRNGALVFSRSASVSIPLVVQESRVLSIADDSDSSAVTTNSDTVDGRSARRSSSAAVAGLVLELTRSIEAYRASDPGATIDHVVIGGDVGIEETFAEAVQERLQLTTQFYNPATSFGWEPDEGVAASAFAASLGLVLGHAGDGKLHFDFLHPKRTVSVTQERLKRAPLVAAVVVLFVGAAGVAFAQYTKPGRAKLAKIEEQILAYEENEKENKAFLAVVDNLVNFDEGQYVWVDVLYDIISVIPSNQEIVIDLLDMDYKDNRVVLKTRAKTPHIAGKMQTALRAFRRGDRKNPRFDCKIGSMTEKKGEKYPFHQTITVAIEDDRPKKKSSRKRSSGD